MLQYSRENIIRLKIYLDRPYVTKYVTDEVSGRFGKQPIMSLASGWSAKGLKVL
jgi:hypothetical protein